jgi:transporter family protein
VKRWLILSLIALFIWGFWGLFANLASSYVDSYSALFWETMGALIVGLFVLLAFLRIKGLKVEPRKGLGFGTLTGVSYTVGLIFFFVALGATAAQGPSGPTGHVHTILVVTGMYPIVASVVNYFVFKEPLSTRQFVGLGMALTAIAIFSSGGELAVEVSLWLALSIIALFLWGLWGVFANLTSRYFDGYNALFWEALGSVVVGVFVLFALLGVVGLEMEPRGVLFGVLTGIALHSGIIFMLFALSATAVNSSNDNPTETAEETPEPTGKVHTILVLTAMYPLPAAGLNYLILDEPFSGLQLIGIVIALGAIAIFVSGE